MGFFGQFWISDNAALDWLERQQQAADSPEAIAAARYRLARAMQEATYRLTQANGLEVWDLPGGRHRALVTPARKRDGVAKPMPAVVGVIKGRGGRRFKASKSP